MLCPTAHINTSYSHLIAVIIFAERSTSALVQTDLETMNDPLFLEVISKKSVVPEICQEKKARAY